MFKGTPRAGGSASARPQPYPTPGGGSAGRQSSRGAQVISPRTMARDKWNRFFNGNAFLEPGVSNRLALSLRCGVPGEIDFALDRLLQISGQDPDLLRLSEFPGLVDGLLDLVRAFLDARSKDRAGDTRGLWQDEAREQTRRRACESALVLRNLTLEKNSTPTVNKHPAVRQLIVDTLEEGALEGTEDTNELRVYLLEVLECIAEETPLQLPGAPSRAAGKSTKPAEPSNSPSQRLFPLLVALTRSPDRALVLAAFRCLTALSVNEASDATLALLTYEQVEPLPKPHPHPIHTAIELLPIADADLSSVVLDYIYEHTLFPANAVLFCARLDLVQVLRLVCTKLHLGAGKETLDITLPSRDFIDPDWLAEQDTRHKRPVLASEMVQPSAKLEGEILNQLTALPEPARTLAWMRTVFEPVHGADITQIALWQAYKAEFEPLANLKLTASLLPAGEIIKMTSEAFESALPMVMDLPSGEKKFVISGMRTRDRTDMRTVYVCRWDGCPSPFGPSSPSALYWHIHHTHLAVDSPPNACAWSSCDYSSEASDAATRTAAISLHSRAHIPSYRPPPGYGDPPTPHLPADGMLADPPIHLQYHHYSAQQDREGGLTGLGFLACLVLRNVARTVKEALGNPAGGASVNSLSGGEVSIFEALAEAADGAQQKDGISTRLDKIDFAEAKGGSQALLGLERKLLSTTMEDHGLATILGEVLAVVKECRQGIKIVDAEEVAARRREAEEEAFEQQRLQQQQQQQAREPMEGVVFE